MSEIQVASVLNGGVLVSLRTEVSGNTQYHKRTLEHPHAGSAGEERSLVELEKVVWDPDEQKEAERVRDKAAWMIKSICSKTDHGLLCSEEREPELYAALEEAQELATDFNRTASFTHVSVRAVCGRIARDDEQTIKAMADSALKLIDQMQAALEELNTTKVRKLAAKALEIGKMLTGTPREDVQAVVDLYRAECTRIVAAGEAAAVDLDSYSIERIEEARTAFLDLEETGVVVQIAEQVRAIDFDPAPATNGSNGTGTVPAPLDFEEV